jgi:ATP-dependent 26S proteasome regulatory subunit
MKEIIRNYIRAGFAGLYLVTHEEVRAESVLKAVAEELDYGLFAWTITSGLLNTQTGAIEQVQDPVEVVGTMSDLPEKSILVLKDFHQFLGDSMQPASPMITRILKEQIRESRCNGKVIIVVGCTLKLPPELEKELTVVEFNLPDKAALATVARNIAESGGVDVDETSLEQIVDSATGLTTTEAEDIMALSVIDERHLSPRFIAREKARAVKKGGILEIVEPKETVADVGGLDNLKQWLSKRRNAFTQDAVDFGLPTPKGVLILGIPGTGKSLTAKTASSILERPILRLDAGKLFAGIVGESEGNLRHAIQTAEAIAPTILWIDEIEKGMSGSRSSAATDGGTSARVFGSFVSWMQEKTAPVFVVATANDVSQLPPELLRKGRFDELFFVDLPDEEERRAIWQIHLTKRNRDAGRFDLNAFVKLSDGFTGAEIEQVVVDALFECFDTGRELDTRAVLQAVEHTVPLSVSMAEQIKSMRQWAKGRTRPASTAGSAVRGRTTRKLVT